MTNVTHKSVAKTYLGWTLGLFLLGVFLAVFLRLESAVGRAVDPAVMDQMLTYHGVIMVFLFLVPVIPVVLGYFLLPLQLGAGDVSLPRLSRAGLVCFILGSLLVLGSMVQQPVDSGWTFALPDVLDGGLAMAVMAGGLVLVALSWVLTGVSFITTVHRGRASDMGLFDMPVLAWSLYLTAFVLVISGLVFAVLVAALAMAILTGKGPLAGDVDPLLWQNAFWFVTTPAAFFALIPAVGVMSDVIAGISRKTLTGYRIVVWSMVVLLATGFCTWGSHMLGGGQASDVGFAFSALGLIAVIPAALIVYCWLATLSRGAIACAAPTTYTMAFLLSGGIGTVMGLFLLNPSVGSYLSSTMFSTAYIHYVMMGGVVTALLAGLHYWWPLSTGRVYDPLLGRASGALYMIGLNLAFFPQILMGTRGLPQGIHQTPDGMSGLALISSIGMAVLLAGLGLMIFNLVKAWVGGKRAEANPWGATSREWTGGLRTEDAG